MSGLDYAYDRKFICLILENFPVAFEFLDFLPNPEKRGTEKILANNVPSSGSAGVKKLKCFMWYNYFKWLRWMKLLNPWDLLNRLNWLIWSK